MKVYVFGLGYIGFPMATWASLRGYQVSGIDINPKVVEAIVQGANMNIHEYYNGIHILQLAQGLIKENQLSVSTDYDRTDEDPSVFVITVGITPRKDGYQDLSPIKEVLNKILPTLVDGDLILFRTTMIPGTCEELIAPQLKVLGKKIYLAYSPETISETYAFEEFQKNPSILAAMDDKSYSIAESFLLSLSDANIHKASNMKTAEMAKIVQNISRDVNVALINELSETALYLDVDIHELRELVNTHPRVELLQPGPGVGGYCLPNALGYLISAFEDKEKAPLTLIETARQLNDLRPRKIVDIIKHGLSDVGKNIKGSTIAIIGLAMKDYCADCRYSPALDIAALLIKEGAEVRGYDPLVPQTYPFQVSSFEACIKNADLLVITVKQVDIKFNIQEITQAMANPPVIVDTRNIFPKNIGIKLYVS